MVSALAQVVPLAARSYLPTQVYLFASDAEFEEYCDAAAGRSCSGLAGLFLPGQYGDYLLVSGDRSDQARAVACHELTHAFVRDGSSYVPVWLNEGLAEFWGSFSVVGKDVRIGRPDEEHLALLRRQGLLPLATVLGVTYESPEYNVPARRPAFYAQAWLLTHYLLLGKPDGRAMLGRYLARLQAGEEPEEAFRAAFGESSEQLNKELYGYTQRQPDERHGPPDREARGRRARRTPPAPPRRGPRAAGAADLRLPEVRPAGVPAAARRGPPPQPDLAARHRPPGRPPGEGGERPGSRRRCSGRRRGARACAGAAPRARAGRPPPPGRGAHGGRRRRDPAAGGPGARARPGRPRSRARVRARARRSRHHLPALAPGRTPPRGSVRSSGRSTSRPPVPMRRRRWRSSWRAPASARAPTRSCSASSRTPRTRGSARSCPSCVRRVELATAEPAPRPRGGTAMRPGLRGRARRHQRPRQAEPRSAPPSSGSGT